MTLAAIAGLVVCLAGAVGLQIARDRLYAGQIARDRAHPVRPIGRGREAAGARLRCAVGGRLLDSRHPALRRRAPGRASARRNYELLFPLLDLTTTLDPYFSIAYRFGAIFLSEASPGGPGRPDQAIALLQKGVAAQPGKWQYLHDIAFVYYWHFRDFDDRGDVVPARVGASRTRRTGSSRSRRRCSARAATARPPGSCGTRFCQSEEEWLRRNADAQPQPARRRRRRSTSCRRSSTGFRRPPGSSIRGRLSSGAASCAAFRSIRLARRSRSIPPPARVSVSRSSSLSPLPQHLQTPRLMTDATLALVGLAILGLAVGSFLNVCIHRLPRGDRSCSRRRAARTAATCCGWSDNIPVLSYAVARRQVPQVPGRRSRSAIRSSSS